MTALTSVASRAAQPTRDEAALCGVRSVRFVVPASIGARFADVLGEFLLWTPYPMDRRLDGSFVVTLGLERGRRWRYRFLIDGERLINDWEADDYLMNADGSSTSVLAT